MFICISRCVLYLQVISSVVFFEQDAENNKYIPIVIAVHLPESREFFISQYPCE